MTGHFPRGAFRSPGRRAHRLAFALCVCSIPSGDGNAADGTPRAVGPPFVINEEVAGNQYDHDFAVDGTGGFVAVWIGPGSRILGRRFDAAGVALGGDFTVNTPLQPVVSPEIAMRADGAFVVAWAADSDTIRARQYGADGMPLGGEITVAADLLDAGGRPAIGMAANGDFVVAWYRTSNILGGDGEVWARFYLANGSPKGAGFRANTFNTGFQILPSVGTDAAGNTVIAWQSAAQDGDGSGIYAKTYDNDGNQIGPEFRVNTVTAGEQGFPSVARAPGGEFTIAWTEDVDFETISGSTTIVGGIVKARRYSALGSPLGGELLLQTNAFEGNAFPQLKVDQNGRLAAVWLQGEPGNAVVTFRARLFGADGIAETDDFAVAQEALLSPNLVLPSASPHPGGGFWFVNEQDAVDGSAAGVVGRRFDDAPEPPDVEAEPFLVPEITANLQFRPRVASDAEGNFVVVWDEEEGLGRKPGPGPLGFGPPGGIWARLHDKDGIALGGDFRIDDGAPVNSTRPDVAMAPTGEFVVVWRNQLNDRIFGRRFRADGQPEGGSFLVSTLGYDDVDQPRVKMVQDRRFVVVWEAELTGATDTDIRARRFAANGNPLDASEFIVNGTTAQDQREPALGTDDDGDFVVVWLDDSGPQQEVVGQRVRSDGMFFGGEFPVNTPNGNFKFGATVAMNGGGAFVVFWKDGGGPVRGQRYNASGVPQGGEFNVPGSAGGGNLDTLMATDGSFTLVREESSGNPDVIAAARFDPDGEALGEDFVVVAEGAGEFNSQPSIAAGAGGQFIVAWENNGSLPRRAVFARISDLGASLSQPLPGEIRVNRATAGPQQAPKAAMSGDGQTVVVWNAQGQDGDGFGVYGRVLRPDGSFRSNEFRLNQTTTGDQYFPFVAVAPNGLFFIATWTSGNILSSENDVYMRRFTLDGTALTDEKLVHTGETTGFQGSSPIAMDGAGNFVIAWLDQPVQAAGADLTAQRYLANGAPVGAPFRVNTDSTTALVSPTASMADDGAFVIAWEMGDADGSGVFARRYNRFGVPRGDSFRVNGVQAGPQIYPAAAIAPDGSFVIAWRGDVNITVQCFDADGLPIGNEFAVDAGTTETLDIPAIGIDGEGRFTIAWSADTGGIDATEIFARRFDGNGFPMGPEFLANLYHDDDQRFPALAMNPEGTHAIVWQSREQDGSADGIYARLYSAPPITDPFAAWASQFNNPGVSDFLADTDHDGIVNLLEYKANTDPTDPSSHDRPMVGITTIGPDRFITISYRERTDDPALDCWLEFSTDLELWFSNSGMNHTVEISRMDNGDGTETVTARALLPSGTDGQFLRERVSR